MAAKTQTTPHLARSWNTRAKERLCAWKKNPQTVTTIPLSIKVCREADLEHEKSARQYAHVFHHKNVICVAHAFEKLPDCWALAILLHEVGHLLAGYRGNEAAANVAVTDASGVPIIYRDGPYGQQLEYIEPSLKSQAREFLYGEDE
jgi:hypothetical protein